MYDKIEFEEVLESILKNAKNGNPPKFFISGNGNETQVFYNGINIGNKITKVIYKQDVNETLGATMEVDLS